MHLAPHSVTLRHIVFADAARRPRRPIDHTPRLLVPMSIAADEAAGSAQEREDFVRWLLRRAALDARMYRPETLHRRLSACLRELKCDCVRDARAVLDRNPGLLPRAISALVIGVTSFFRDHHVFARLADDILPALCAGGRALRIWSVGCSDGHEIYSIAMLLAQRRVLHACNLIGTDCRADAIDRLKAGVYDEAALRHVPAHLHNSFEPHPLGWRIISSIRSAVRARVACALHSLEHGPWDIICCRNMAMYLLPETSAALMQSLAHRLRPGGYLVLGKAERPAGVQGLEYVGPCIYRRHPVGK